MYCFAQRIAGRPRLAFQDSSSSAACEFRGPLPQGHTRYHRERRDRKEISNRFAAHLASDEHINLSAMILVIDEAFVNLCAGQVRETQRNYTIDRLTIL